MRENLMEKMSESSPHFRIKMKKKKKTIITKEERNADVGEIFYISVFVA